MMKAYLDMATQKNCTLEMSFGEPGLRGYNNQIEVRVINNRTSRMCIRRISDTELNIIQFDYFKMLLESMFREVWV